MKGKKPQKQLLQFVMLSLLSVVSVLVMANESFAALQCYSCHGQTNDIRPLDTAPGSASSVRDSATGAVKGSHAKHLAATTDASKCNVCHNTQMTVPGHRDGKIELAAGLQYHKGAGNITFTNQTSVPVLGSCATAVCHNSTSTSVGVATPDWGTTATCSSCHQTSPTTLSHKKHLVDTTFKKADCIDCHASTVEGVSTTANHVDNSISVTGYTVQGKAKASAVSTCATTYCHSSGQGATAAVATPVYAPVTWGGTVTCGSCHATTGMATGRHTTHLGSNTNCGNCHTGSTATSYPSTAHVDGSINVAAGVGYSAAVTAGDGYGTCSTASCHAYFTDVAPKVTRAWGTTGISCTACHAGTPITGAHAVHNALPAVASNCDYCHTSSADTTHANGFVNLSGTVGRLMAAPVAKHASNGYTATCTTTCHSAFTTAGTTPNWGQQSDCNTCHTSTTGAHNKHNASASVIAAATGGLAANTCGVCHAGATTTVVSTGHANGTINVTQVGGGTTPKHAAGAYSATCTTACHNPYSTSVTIATPNWGTTGVACTICHTAGFTVTGPATGSHAAHTAATGATCTSCHAASTSTTVAPAAGHLDGNIDVTGTVDVGYTPNKAKGSPAASCSTASCHANPYGTGSVATPNWGVVSGCKACHTNSLTNDFAAGPATGSHIKHMTTTYGTTVACSSCHTTPGSGAAHNNGSINVIQYAAAEPKHAGAPYKADGCSNISCHGGVAFSASATWGANLDCAGCHGFPPSGSSHASVTNGNCNSCHSEVTAGSFTKTTATFATPSLHMNGVTDGGNCDACHGYPPVQSMAGFGKNANYSSAKLQNYSGGGGAHSVAGHLALTLKASNGGAFDGCVTCHPSGATHNEGAGVFQTAKVQVTVDTQFKFDKNLPIVYNKVSGPKSTGTCSNVSCHFKPTPIWSAETYTQGH